MKKLSLITTLLAATLLSACGDKQAEEVEVSAVVEEAKKETYNIITDSKEIIDQAKDAAAIMEEAAKKQKEALDAM